MSNLNEITKDCMGERMAEHNESIYNEVDQYL